MRTHDRNAPIWELTFYHGVERLTTRSGADWGPTPVI
jgi:hypothetical protein